MIQNIIEFINNHEILTSIWLILLISIIFITIQERFSKVKQINRNKAIYLMNNKDSIIIDLRSEKDFKKGHIINSINLPNFDVEKFKKYEKKNIILTSANSLEIFSPAEKLTKKGFKNIYILKEGIIGWLNNNLPLIK